MEKFELDENDQLTHLSHFKTRCYQCNKLIVGTIPGELAEAWAACGECGCTTPAKNDMVWH